GAGSVPAQGSRTLRRCAPGWSSGPDAGRSIGSRRAPNGVPQDRGADGAPVPAEVQMAVGGVFGEAEVHSAGLVAGTMQQLDLAHGGRVVEPAPALGRGAGGLRLPQEVVGRGERLDAGADGEGAKRSTLRVAEGVPERAVVEDARPPLKSARHQGLAVAVQVAP